MNIYVENRQKRFNSYLFFDLNKHYIMVNTVVTFGNNRIPSATSFPVVIDKTNQSSLQRRIYLIIGILILIIILIPNILLIEKDPDDFAFHLLFIVHASSLRFSSFSLFLSQVFYYYFSFQRRSIDVGLFVFKSVN